MNRELNKVRRAIFFVSMVVTTMLTPCASMASEDSSIEFSGFARVVAGYLDTDQAYFEGYEDELTFTEKSLVGFQADYAVTDEISLSGQLLLHSDSQHQSGLEWLYLSYDPNPDWQLKVGRLRTPYLKYSDVFDVGYAYPWISPPRQLYGSYLFFPRYEGANLRYRFNIDQVYIDVEAYYGEFSDDIDANGAKFHIDANDMYGGIVEVNYNGWQLRGASFLVDKIRAGAEGIETLTSALDQAGFADLATFFTINGSTEAYIFGLTYDSLDWVLSAEYVDVASTITILAGIENYYFTVGRYFGEYQFLVTYAKANQELTFFENTIPPGVDPRLDQLYFGIEQVISQFPTDELNSVTLTGRWDFRPNMAFKAEVSFLNGYNGKSSMFELKADAEGFDRKAVLYQFGVEWVF